MRIQNTADHRLLYILEVYISINYVSKNNHRVQTRELDDVLHVRDKGRDTVERTEIQI